MSVSLKATLKFNYYFEDVPIFPQTHETKQALLTPDEHTSQWKESWSQARSSSRSKCVLPVCYPRCAVSWCISEQTSHSHFSLWPRAKLTSLLLILFPPFIEMFKMMKRTWDYCQQASNQFNSAKASNSQRGNNLEAAEGYSGCKVALSLFQLYHVMWHWGGGRSAASWPPEWISLNKITVNEQICDNDHCSAGKVILDPTVDWGFKYLNLKSKMCICKCY